MLPVTLNYLYYMKMLFVTPILILIALANVVNAQPAPKLENNAKDTITYTEGILTKDGDATAIYKVVGEKHAFRLGLLDVLPQYPGGERKFRDTLNNKYRDFYRDEPSAISLTFVIGYDGKLSNFKSVWSTHPKVEKRLFRFIKALPRWTPGIKNNKYALSLYEIQLGTR